ncbi:MAG TPA: nucleotidyltransferase domain-containing protein, partial [Planctomycetaceae bacterium]
MQNDEVANAFDEVADLLEIQGANTFRVRAYRNAARTLRDLAEPVADLAADPDALDDLPGIGKDLAGKIRTLVTTGKLPQLEELRAQVPPGVGEMLRIPGLGPKKAAALFRELGVTTLAGLKKAAQEGRIAGLKGFGKKTEQAILANIDQAAEAAKRTLLAVAAESVEPILADLRSLESVHAIDAAGSYRRRQETVGDLDVLATSDDPEAVMDRLAGHEFVERVLLRGPTKMRVRLRTGLELDLRVLDEASYGA